MRWQETGRSRRGGGKGGEQEWGSQERGEGRGLGQEGGVVDKWRSVLLFQGSQDRDPPARPEPPTPRAMRSKPSCRSGFGQRPPWGGSNRSQHMDGMSAGKRRA